MARGFLCLVLHAHLPFVRHPEYNDSLEERWLHEAMTETYLPLIDMLLGFERDGVDWRLTMSITPPLAAMLGDELLQARYRRHLEKLLELAEKELVRTRAMPEFHDTARMYLRKLTRAHQLFVDHYRGDILSAFRAFRDGGKLELITCGATHGFLPVLRHVPAAVRAQIRVGVESYRQTFGAAPAGIWNGECGYFRGVEETLAENGVKYFFTDAHGVLYASIRPRYGVFAPLKTPAGVSVFGRDLESTRSVWSADTGYPGDYRYREFYRDIGFDLDAEYIGPYIHESGIQVATGHKYYRITGKVDLKDKHPYNEREALQAAADHAGHFLYSRQQQTLHLTSLLDRPPLIVAPYDAELFGHWWYEGPEFLNYLIRKIHYDQRDIALTTPSEYLARFPENQEAQPCESSWGNNGFAEVWLDNLNDWLYRHIHKSSERMNQLALRFTEPTELQRRALNQAAREALLAQASDWAFIMKSRTTVDYARKRSKDHLHRFGVLYDMLQSGELREDIISEIEGKDTIFPWMDYTVWR